MSNASIKRIAPVMTTVSDINTGLMDAFDGDGVLGTGKLKKNQLSATFGKKCNLQDDNKQ